MGFSPLVCQERFRGAHGVSTFSAFWRYDSRPHLLTPLSGHWLFTNSKH